MEVDRQHLSEVFPAHVQGVLSEVSALYQPYVEKLYSADQDQVLEGIKEIKNFVIGNNKRKTNFIVLGAVPRLVYLIQDDNVSPVLKVQSAVVLGSLAKGINTNVQNLLDHGVAETMCGCLISKDLQLYEACIRCLRTIIASSDVTGKLLYVNSLAVLPQMLENLNKSNCTQECTCEIVSHCCKTKDHQSLLLNLDIINLLGDLLITSVRRVKVKALDAFSVICFRNYESCEQCAMIKIKNTDQPLIEVLIKLLAQSQPNEIQLRAAKCLTFMFRVGVLTTESRNSVIIRKVLPCLVRMCDMECTFEERIAGAETIAYLTEIDPPLQRLAYICEQFPHKLEVYFKHPAIGDTKNPSDMKRFKHALKYRQSLRRVGLLSYASLLSNDEDIRKQVATETLVSHVAESMVDSCTPIRVAALRCLLSLSRSIHLLRTTFQDMGIWKALLKLMQEPKKDLEETRVLSSILCNMLLEFSPSKKDLKSTGLLQTVCEWVNVDSLKLNAVWCLMNMSFQADTTLKLEIMEAVGFDQIMRLLTDGDRNVIIRTLGLLRNILHLAEDRVMSQHGLNTIEACKHVLTVFSEAGAGIPSLCAEYECIRAHCVCVLACVAAAEGGSAAQVCLQNEVELLQQVVNFLVHFDANLQMATATFIHNFIQLESLSVERQALLADYGALNGLRQLQSTSDTVLYDKVEQILQHFQNTKM